MKMNNGQVMIHKWELSARQSLMSIAGANKNKLFSCQPARAGMNSKALAGGKITLWSVATCSRPRSKQLDFPIPCTYDEIKKGDS